MLGTDGAVLVEARIAHLTGRDVLCIAKTFLIEKCCCFIQFACTNA